MSVKLVRKSDINRKVVREAFLFNKNKKDISIRFHEKYEWQGECWIWRKPKSFEFHVNVIVGGITPRRFSYEFFKGKIPSGKRITTTCGNYYCVNPNHLTLTTYSESAKRKNKLRVGQICEKHKIARLSCGRGSVCIKCRLETTHKWAIKNPHRVKESYKKYNKKRSLAAGILPRRTDRKCRKCLTPYTLCSDGRSRCKQCAKIRHQGYYLKRK